MKPIIYIFGNPSGVFSSYPEDHTKSFFFDFIKKARNNSQIFIHRKDNFLHYCYIRKMATDKSIGICLCIDHIYSDVNQLFRLFDDVFAKMIQNGDIVKVDNANAIGWATKNFNKESIAIQEYTKSIVDSLDLSNDNCKPLPPVNFAISINDCIELDLETQNNKLSSAIERYSNIYVVNKKSEIEKVSSFLSVVSKKDEEIGRLNEELKKKDIECNKLKEEKVKISRQKKQFQYVILLLVVIVGCGVGLFFLNQSLNNTQYLLTQEQEKVNSLSQKNSSLKESLSSEKRLKEEVERKFANFKTDIGEKFPLLISDIEIANVSYGGDVETDYGNTIYSSNTMYLKPKIKYRGMKSGESITLYVRLYTPSGMSSGTSSPSGYSFSESCYVYSGENTLTLMGWGGQSKGHWSRGSYRFEIWYNNVCLKEKTFTVY